MDDINNELNDVEGTESVMKIDFFEPSRLRWQATAAAATGGAVAGGTIDLFVGGASFGTGVLIGGTLGAIGGYFGAGGYESYTESGSTTISLGPTTELLCLLTGAGVSAAKVLKNRGRADPNNVCIRFDHKAFVPDKDARSEIDGLKKSQKATSMLEKAIRQAIES
ncbi:hypothetical protein Q31b_42690 [Novipirellula aureliae]|uniref:Uncharacterized protein n=2 Tax=Novipirellula aureliae TaxID=2527966 RepID=A0A5C6DPB0_9BACT|nr:hypothetical protein Q31b_42690 [Novipirellula aureliae]